jgi:hypothetical protein
MSLNDRLKDIQRVEPTEEQRRYAIEYERRMDNAYKVCTILNKYFNDVHGISTFHVLKKNGFIGDVYIQGPNEQQRSMNQHSYITNEEFIQRMSSYVDETQLHYENHESGTYFMVKATGVEKILEVETAKEVQEAKEFQLRRSNTNRDEQERISILYRTVKDKEMDLFGLPLRPTSFLRSIVANVDTMANCFICRKSMCATTPTTYIYRMADPHSGSRFVATNNMDDTRGMQYVNLGQRLCEKCTNEHLRPLILSMVREHNSRPLANTPCEGRSQSECALDINRCRWGLTEDKLLGKKFSCLPVQRSNNEDPEWTMKIDRTSRSKSIDVIDNELAIFKKAFIRDIEDHVGLHDKNFKNVFDTDMMQRLDGYTAMELDDKRSLLKDLVELLPVRIPI